MPKRIGLFQRREGLSVTQFQDYYENNHAPLAASCFGHLFASYTHSYVDHLVRGAEDIDVIAELYSKPQVSEKKNSPRAAS